MVHEAIIADQGNNKPLSSLQALDKSQRQADFFFVVGARKNLVEEDQCWLIDFLDFQQAIQSSDLVLEMAQTVLDWLAVAQFTQQHVEQSAGVRLYRQWAAYLAQDN